MVSGFDVRVCGGVDVVGCACCCCICCCVSPLLVCVFVVGVDRGGNSVDAVVCACCCCWIRCCLYLLSLHVSLVLIIVDVFCFIVVSVVFDFRFVDWLVYVVCSRCVMLLFCFFLFFV